MQYEVKWIEKNKDGSTSEESIRMKASSPENAKEQVKAIGNVVEIKTITRII
jgi:hypothetical protein